MTELIELLENNYKGTTVVAPVASGIGFEPEYQGDQCQCDCDTGSPGR